MSSFSLTIAAVALTSVAPVNDWENTGVNSINRLAPRAYTVPLADAGDAFTEELDPKSPYRMSLNGMWKFSWAGNPDLRVKDFWHADFDDENWFVIDVPSCVELRGFGSPGYTNQRYPHKLDWPRIRDRQTGAADYNPVASYRRKFTLPESWASRRVILRFDGVYSAYYVWVNGKKVGYAEDSKLPSEFDVTPYLNTQPSAANLLCVEVYRWSDGSYLEDQDMTRYCGIFRDVTLWAMPKDGIWDVVVRTHPTAVGDDSWRLEADVEDLKGEVAPGAAPTPVFATLYETDGREVGELKPTSVPGSFALELKPRLWSAEKPNLYALVVKKGDDIRMRRIGFKEQKIENGVFKVNGVAVKFKGVNRHESNPDNGRAVTLKDMLSDIELMKRFNINTVRTCHYPDHRLWYDLCDRYGIYVVAEANVEGHEPQYGDNGLGRFVEWKSSIVERNERNVKFYRDHPSVTMWSLGNETGSGLCFSNAADRVRLADPSRPVHWERDNPIADVDSVMYPSVAWLELLGQLGEKQNGPAEVEAARKALMKCNGRGSDQTPGKCFFVCEYAHAMGNAVGDFADYWDVFYRYDRFCGGCVWDWVDQAVWKYTGKVDRRTGKRDRYLSYGGDFDEDPNDGPFNCNGIVDPLRRVSAKLVEIGHVHRNLVVTRSTVAGGNAFAIVFELWNRFSFTSADDFACTWTLLENGKKVTSGEFVAPAVKPLSRCRFTVPGLVESVANTDPGAEVFVNFEFKTRFDALWAKRGHVIARDQVALGSNKPALPMRNAPDSKSGELVKFSADEKTVTVVAGPTKAVFCRRSGTLCELVKNGRIVIKDPAPGIVAGPQFTCMRAFTDNDRWLRESFYHSGLTQLSYHARPIRVSGNTVTCSVKVTGSKSGGFEHLAVWKFSPDGSIAVENTVTPFGTMPHGSMNPNDTTAVLPRAGLSLRLAKGWEKMSYYGRGPWENYIDRKSGSFFGIWQSTVTEQFEPYVRPQDCGSKCDVRWAEFFDGKGGKVRFSASVPLYMQALHYSLEDLEFSRQRPRESHFRTPLVVRDETYLNLDIRQFGLGGASCGPMTQEKYRFAVEPWSWTLFID